MEPQKERIHRVNTESLHYNCLAVLAEISKEIRFGKSGHQQVAPSAFPFETLRFGINLIFLCQFFLANYLFRKEIHKREAIFA